MSIDKDLKRDLEMLRRLLPKNIRGRLMYCAMYLAAYELARTCIIDGVRSFLAEEYTLAGPRKSPQYRKEVERRDKDLLIASCLWLADGRVLNNQDVEEMRRIRNFRDRIAHDLPSLLIDSPEELDLLEFDKLDEIYRKVDNFWGEVAADTDPQFDDVEVDYKNIQSAAYTLLSYIYVVVDEEFEKDPW